ncbi:MAG TPA: (d)CMP kinase [Candidatus Limivicinus faecipullorum]|nr:(d)CMP kinase [Candidatus Limivicinus faecipullorum]
MNEFFSIAIDGPSGAGKSSLAKKLAEAFRFIYVDTGAIYRTLGLAAYRRGIDRKDEKAVMELLPKIKIEMGYNQAGEQRMYLDGEDVSEQIRLPEISICASDVSSHQAVRTYLLDMQRDFARKNNVIMDGRDIGTVVLPDAELKIFLTASSEARARRRMLEQKNKGIEESFEDVLREIEYRDKQDSSRTAAPLKAAEDALVVDTSDINFDESLRLLTELVVTRLSPERKDRQ